MSGLERMLILPCKYYIIYKFKVCCHVDLMFVVCLLLFLSGQMKSFYFLPIQYCVPFVFTICFSGEILM